MNIEAAKNLARLLENDRQVGKLKGTEKGMEDLFVPFDEGNTKSPIPNDESSNTLRSLMNELKKCFNLIKKSDNQESFSKQDEEQFVQKVTDIFSRDPKPDQILSEYLNAHGDKTLATEEYQFASALIGAFNGVNDYILSENANRRASELETEFNEVQQELNKTNQLAKDMEQKAIDIGISLDDESMETYKNQLNNEEDTLKQEITDLRTDLGEDKYLSNLSANSKYKLAEENTKQARKSLLSAQAKHLSSDAAKKQMEDYDMQIKNVEDAYKDKDNHYRNARLNESRKEISDRTSQNEYEKKVNDIKMELSNLESKNVGKLIGTEDELRNKTNTFTTARSSLNTILGNKTKTDQLSQFFKNADNPQEAYNRMLTEEPDTLKAMGNVISEYMRARDNILEAYDPEGRKNMEAEFGKIEKAMGTPQLESMRKTFDVRLESMETSLGAQQEFYENEHNRTNSDVSRYRKLRNDLSTLQNQRPERNVLGNTNRDSGRYQEERDNILKEHKNKVKEICEKIGIKKADEIEKYAELKNWNSLKEQVNRQANLDKKAYDGQEKRFGIIEEELQKSRNEALKDRKESYTPEQRELETKLLDKVSKLQNVRDKKENYYLLEESKSTFKQNIGAALAEENNFCRKADGVLGKNLPGDKIAAGLSSLSTKLTGPVKKGRNTREFDELDKSLKNAEKIFSGKDKEFNKLPLDQQLKARKDALEELGKNAEKYLLEKDKVPHIWPFASATGFKRREAANEILNYCNSAKLQLDEESPLAYNMHNRIASHKQPNGQWKDNLSQSLTDMVMESSIDKVNKKLGIEPKKPEKQAEQNRNIEFNVSAPKKSGGKVI